MRSRAVCRAMTHALLGHLTAAGILERAGGKGAAYLRVTPRFLSHAEGTAGRLRLQTGVDDEHAALQSALSTWDGYRLNAYQGALFLRDLLEERGQLGTLQRTFMVLDSFAVAGA